MKYVDVGGRSRNELESALQSSDLDLVRDAAAGIAEAEDWKWAREQLSKLLRHKDPWVVRSAVRGMATLVRLERPVDIEALKIELAGFGEKFPDTLPYVEEALDDIAICARSRG